VPAPETTLDARKNALALAWELAEQATLQLNDGKLNEAMVTAQVASAWAQIAEVGSTLQVANIRTT
jgi:hypothetical protein